jgi:MFS family permease
MFFRSQPILIHSICVCLGGVFIFVWPFVPTLPGNVVFCLIYGFLSGAFISLPPSSIASTTLEMSMFGARLGIAVTCNGFGLLMGPPIAGALISRGSGNGYWHASILSGLAVVLGGVLLGTAGKFKSGSNRNAPVRNNGS